MLTPAQPWQTLTVTETTQQLAVDPAVGLSAAEVQLRRERYGANSLPEAPRRPWWKLFLRQFASPLIYILLLAAVIALAMEKLGDAGVILVVVFLNAVIGAVQEGRAERSMESLRRLAALHTRVLREGRELLLESHELVPGDVLLLGAGDAIPADARLLEVAALEASEASLTGESLPINKSVAPCLPNALLADRVSLVFAGTHVAAGRGRAVVFATGLFTEVGKIARLTASAIEPMTPLESRLQQFGRLLAGAAVGLFALVLLLGLGRGLPPGEVFMVAVSEMVSVIPEGLPVALTIALAVGMQRMAGRGAIIRRLAAVETLGSISVICTDKTGTLTQNEMTVTELWLPRRGPVEVSGVGYAPEGTFRTAAGELDPANEPEVAALLAAAVLCNDAQLVPPDLTVPRWRPLGDPTEAALLTAGLKAFIDPEQTRGAWPRHRELPFDSRAKLMATQHGQGEQIRVIVKGAPEMTLSLCAIGETERTATLAAAHRMAGRALRVLAVTEAPSVALDDMGDFSQFAGRLRLLGLVGQMDPPRPEAGPAVAECRAAGIRSIMVTGDHKLTGLAVARQLGLARDGDLALDGAELEALPEQDLRAQLHRIAVFARVQPAQKLRIVEALQANGEVVAMTGDGVNDAPALARADVGVAMGVTGTEVAKSTAKVILTDDNFATLVRAVEEGRLVYRNLQKVLLFLFATSLDEVLVLLLALIFGYPLPLAAVQILWINLVTEGTVTVNLIMESAEGDEMRHRPLPRSAPLFTRLMVGRLLVMVPTSVAVTLGYFIWQLNAGRPFALVQTETFTLLAICQWFNVLNCRSETRTTLKPRGWRNGWLIGGLVLGNLLQAAVVYAPPLNRIFHTVPIPMADFFLIGALGSLVLWAEELRKWLARRTLAQATDPLA
jgi:Ca2+-transporting ATPase